jgi:hypothetical protein
VRGYWVRLAGFALAGVLLRNNGVYVVAITLGVVALVSAGRRVGFAALAVGAVAFQMVWGGIVLPVAGVEPGPAREPFAVPIQQIARVVAGHEAELTGDQRATVGQLFAGLDGTSGVAQAYDPRWADPVKDTIDDQWFRSHRSDVLKLWFDLGRQHPGEYLAGFLAQNFGYWYPEAYNWNFDLYQSGTGVGLTGEMSLAPKLRGAIMHSGFYNPRPLAVISMLFSIAFLTGLVALAAVVAWLRGNRRVLLVLLPSLVVYLTCLVSPVFAEYRYAFPYLQLVPPLTALPWLALRQAAPK